MAGHRHREYAKLRSLQAKFRAFELDMPDETLPDRIRKLIGQSSERKFAQSVGVSDSSLRSVLKGTQPLISFVVKVAHAKGVTVDWLATGSEPQFPNGSMQMSGAIGSQAMQIVASDGRPVGFADNDDSHLGGDLIRIPQFDIRVSAGAGLVAIEDDERSTAYLSADREWLRRYLPAWAGASAVCGILEGQGDSMEPTIHDGDLIMVVNDPPRWAVDRGGVFVVLQNDHLRIKRLQIIATTGDLHVISDNDSYAVEIIPHDRIDFDIRILAQVFFSGGKLRKFSRR